MSEKLEHVRQEPTEPFVELEREQQQPHPEDGPQVEEPNVPENEALRRSKRIKKSAISTDYKVYNTETVHGRWSHFIWRIHEKPLLIEVGGGW